ncbi:hypothetical protein HanXRQr2_Chr03g0095681 [Helianthus annuus]|uniref:Uncharacterized protein n=1 Tax=Helianthus annuus TaxID=4232 RepID=A0A9K3NU14_HELAN|nr:hypothetical protein HanXRQr2_Chr03g0095681 [Helianthus annuus]KAJ0647665.1 hypothetical protein HanLR1_Chr15g0564221 [Helianthus annuus]KAJ0942467.1 hypothetical protein HanPSC8_Chr03g0092291 [Helianthus annuus]KAJ0952583.1 hypothetical protein HanPSC8_Chr02g0074021 [Helianthus annuus]
MMVVCNGDPFHKGSKHVSQSLNLLLRFLLLFEVFLCRSAIVFF